MISPGATLLLAFLPATTAAGVSVDALDGSSFVENLGQWPADVLFVSPGPRMSVAVVEDGVVLLLHQPVEDGQRRSEVLRLGFQGLGSTPGPTGAGPRAAPRHFFRGDDPLRWVTNARAFEEVRFDGSLGAVSVARIGDGVNLAWTGFDTEDAPGLRWLGNLPEVEQGVGGQSLPGGRLSVVAGGHLALESGSQRMMIGIEGATSGAGGDASLELDWASYLGGSFGDDPTAVDIDATGRVAVIGYTFSADFPVTVGAFDEEYSDGVTTKSDAFVAVLSADGTHLEFATYLGGGNSDNPVAIGFGDNGSIYVAGSTPSPDFPTTDGSFYKSGDGFITRFDSTGSSLITSTLFGGDFFDSIDCMKVHDGGEVTIAGFTTSDDFPVTAPGFNVGVPAPNKQDVFITRFDTETSSVIWSVLYGGAEVDQPKGLDVDEKGDVVITGIASDDLILTETALAGTGKGYFLAKIGNAGRDLVYSSFVGWGPVFVVNACRFDPQGRLMLTGGDATGAIPTTIDALQPSMLGPSDGYLVVVNPDTGVMEYSSYVGGPSSDGGRALEVDASGIVTICGATQSAAFPVTPGSFGVGGADGLDMFVLKLAPSLQQILYATVFGGTCDGEIQVDMAMAAGVAGNVVVVGDTDCDDFPVTPGAYGQSVAGNNDAFIVSLTMLPDGVSPFGASTTGSKGPLAAGVTRMPRIGSRFGLTCTGAPTSSTQGMLALSRAGLAEPVKAAGADLWLHPGALVLIPGIASDEVGWVEVDSPIPNAPWLVGAEVDVQFFFPDEGAGAGVAASNALQIVIQP